MKFSTIFQTIAALSATGFVAAAADNASTDGTQCGFGGEYHPNLDALKGTNIDPSKIRKCKEHPLGSATALLGKRDCYHDAPFGCTDGYCWKQCGVAGSGQWVSLAAHHSRCYPFHQHTDKPSHSAGLLATVDSANGSAAVPTSNATRSRTAAWATLTAALADAAAKLTL